MDYFRSFRKCACVKTIKFLPVSKYRMEHKSLIDALNHEWVFLEERTRSCQICTVPIQTWTYHMEEITSKLFYIHRNCYYLYIDLRGWKGSVTNGLGADTSLPHCLATGIWTLGHKSDHRAEISENINWYDTLAPRPEVLLYWYLACACAVLESEALTIFREETIRIGSTLYKRLSVVFARTSFLINHVNKA